VESVGKLGCKQEDRLIDENIFDTTRCGVYRFDSCPGQERRVVLGEEIAKVDGD
jgi:hypothetical protein